MPCQIKTFFHCKRCLVELPPGTSPMEYARIQAGFLANGDIQVWCNRHDCLVANFSAEDDPPIPAVLQ